MYNKHDYKEKISNYFNKKKKKNDVHDITCFSFFFKWQKFNTEYSSIFVEDVGRHELGLQNHLLEKK